MRFPDVAVNYYPVLLTHSTLVQFSAGNILEKKSSFSQKTVDMSNPVF